MSSFYCKNSAGKGLSKSAGERGCTRNREESRGLTTMLVSDGFQWRSPIAPAMNSRSLAVQIREERGVKREGSAGLYRGGL
jgi:hypothetical protein